MEPERISRRELFINITNELSKRADCRRGSCGCIITLDNRIISTGYNSPLPNETICDLICDISKPCIRTIHAEENAILFAARKGIALEGCSLWTTLSPCVRCSRMIIQTGIIEVYYKADFREKEGFDLLRKHNIYLAKI